MTVQGNGFRRRIEAEERQRILEELRLEGEAQYPFLAVPRLFTRRYRIALMAAGGILGGMLIGAAAIIADYIVFVRVLHFAF